LRTVSPREEESFFRAALLEFIVADPAGVNLEAMDGLAE
jgi:hypothetical protein